MKEEFNLSEKIFDMKNLKNSPSDWLLTQDVKEFIKRLKNALKDWENADWDIIEDIVNRLAGDDLNGT